MLTVRGGGEGKEQAEGKERERRGEESQGYIEEGNGMEREGKEEGKRKQRKQDWKR